MAKSMGFLLPIFAFVLLLGGCATSTISLSLDELERIRIERIEVVYAPEASISWEKVETAYVEQVKAAAEKPKPWKQVLLEDQRAEEESFQRIINSPEGQQHMRDTLAAEIQRRVGAAVTPKFQGTRPVILEVNVLVFSIPPAAQRVLLGGAPVMGAIAVLRDAETGEELAKLDRAAAAGAGNGVLGVLIDQALPDLEDRLFDQYNRQLLEWLQPSA